MLEGDHLIPEIFELLRQNLCGFREHLVLFLRDMVLDILHHLFKLVFKLLIGDIEVAHFKDQFLDCLMLEAAVGDKLRPLFASLGVERRIEDGLFELRVQIQLGKDLFSNLLLGGAIPGTLISGEEILHLAVIGL